MWVVGALPRSSSWRECLGVEFGDVVCLAGFYAWFVLVVC